MLEARQYAALTVICLTIFTIYQTRADFVGYDTYYFLNGICGRGSIDTPVLAQLLFSMLPCNLPFLKFALFFSALFSLFGIAHLGKIFSEKGWLAGIFVFLSPLFIFEFAQLENDMFAYPFLFWALYFFYKGKRWHSRKNILAALGLLVVAAGFWEGAIYYAIAFAFGSVIALAFALPLVAWFNAKIIGNALPNFAVFENLPVLGIAYLFPLLEMGIAGFLFGAGMMLPQFAFFFLLGIMNAKFILHVVPFFAVGATLLITKFPRMEVPLIMTSITLAMLFGAILHLQPPMQETWDAIEYGIANAPAGKLANDWGLGHLVRWAGGTPSAYAGGIWDENYTGKVVISQMDLNCAKLYGEGFTRVFQC